MEILVGKTAGFCYGVKKAVDGAKNENKNSKNVYCLGEIVHNKQVINDLEEQGIKFIENIEDAKGTTIIRAHGVPKEIYEEAKKRNIELKDYTCPNVLRIHKIVEDYSQKGYFVFLCGSSKHPENLGTISHCNKNSYIIEKEDDTFKALEKLEKSGIKKLLVISQTTYSLEKFYIIKEIIENELPRNIELVVKNTICATTEQRQIETKELSKKVDFMIIIGGKNSSNTTKLYEIAKSNCTNTIHIENVNELPKEFIENESFEKIGITAGASTPDWIIKEVIDKLEGNKKMENQLELMNEMDRRFRIGDEVEGEILSITNDVVVISLVGYKSDGVIPFKELTSAEKLEEVLNNIKVGDTIKAKVIKLKNEDNYVVLSRLEFEKEEALGYLEKVYENNEELTIKVTAAKEKGLVAYYNGVRIFIPSSQIDIKYVEDKESLVGTEMTVKLIDFSKENLSKIVASRKTLLEEAKAKKENITWDSLQVGDIVKAEIKRFTNFGAFAEVDGVDGLIHLSQISWSHIKSCEEVLKIGQIVDVKIINLDKDAKKLSLSIKELTPEPWSVVDEKYSEGSAVLGKVVRINDFGAFVELEPGIDGLVHISKISHDHIKHPSEVLSIGEEVKCIILSIDKENKKIALSIKDAE